MADLPEKYNIAVLEIALKILENFIGVRSTGYSLSEISKQLKLTKTRTFRILTTLERFGYVHQDPSTHRYRLGLKLLLLGEHVRRSLDLVNIAAPILNELTAQTGETTFLGTLEGHEAVCIYRHDSPHGIRLFAEIGQRTPLHLGTVPKILLAYQSPAFIEEYFAQSLVRFTPQTITDKTVLSKLLETIRREGIAITRDDMDPGACSVGAPIRDHDGNVIAAISVAGPENRFTPEIMPHITNLVRNAAAEISQQIGYI